MPYCIRVGYNQYARTFLMTISVRKDIIGLRLLKASEIVRKGDSIVEISCLHSCFTIRDLSFRIRLGYFKKTFENMNISFDI